MTRRVATRIAADQVRAAQRRNRRDRCVQVSPGPDGTTTWWAQLPAAASAAAWSAITSLGATYAEEDPSLTVDQARADAFVDLMLSGVEVTREGHHRPARGHRSRGGAAPGGGRRRRPRGRRRRWPRRLVLDLSGAVRVRAARRRLGRGRHRLGAAVHRAARGRPGAARRAYRHAGRDDEHGIPAPEGDQGLRHHEGPGVPDVGLFDRPAAACDVDHAQTLAGGADLGGQPRRPVPSAPPVQAAPTMEPTGSSPTAASRGPHPTAGGARPCPTTPSGHRHRPERPSRLHPQPAASSRSVHLRSEAWAGPPRPPLTTRGSAHLRTAVHSAGSPGRSS